MSEAQKKGFKAPRLNLSGCNKPMIFWRSRIPIVKKQVTYKGEPCEILEGSCLVAENVNIKIVVKRDEFTTNDGTEIVYRVSLMGFDTDSTKESNKNGRGVPVVGSRKSY